MAVPHPPQRQCARFTKDGTRCTNWTRMADGWCHTCDGFTRRDADRAQSTQTQTKQADHAESQWQVADMPPLGSEEAYEVGVTSSAIHDFITSHGGGRDEAEAQIRSLLEDMLTLDTVKTSRHTQTRAWRLKMKQLGYEIRLNSEASAVIGYRSFHAERTYAQVKAGVESRAPRLPRQRPRKEKGWFLAPQQNQPYVVSSTAASQYGKTVLDMRLQRDNAAWLIQRVVQHLEEAGFTPPTKEGESAFADQTGLVWITESFPGYRPYLRAVVPDTARDTGINS